MIGIPNQSTKPSETKDPSNTILAVVCVMVCGIVVGRAINGFKDSTGDKGNLQKEISSLTWMSNGAPTIN
jgi:hypothetical protein